MDTTATVIEAHLNTGKTLPLRSAQTKKGERVFATLDVNPRGEKFYNGWGPQVSPDVTGKVTDIKSLTIDGIGTVKVRQDLTAKGQKRAIATKTFTANDGEQWTLSFRATLLSENVVNLNVQIKKGTASKRRVLTEL